jgi:hypothetical protein
MHFFSLFTFMTLLHVLIIHRRVHSGQQGAASGGSIFSLANAGILFTIVGRNCLSGVG